MPVNKKLSLEQIREVLTEKLPGGSYIINPTQLINYIMAEFERITDDRTIF